MDRQEIIDQLQTHHRAFTDFITALDGDQFLFQPGEKWTAGQQLDHLCRSVRPVALALSLPKFTLKLSFGKSDRPSRTYDELVERYQQKLAEGGQAAGRYVPDGVLLYQKEKLIKSLTRAVNTLAASVGKYSEPELDAYVLPHPLLGKLTIREMLFFTIHHVQHHLEITRRNLPDEPG